MKAKRKSSKISKFLALCLAVVMTLAMSVTAFADVNIDDDTGTITVSGMESDNGATVSAYKIINIKFDDAQQQPVSPVYLWTDEMAAWLKGDGSAEYGSYIGTDGEVTEAYQNLSAADLSAFYKDVAEADIFAAAAATDVMEGQSAELDGLTAGSYLVTAEKTGATYQPMSAKVDIVYSQANGWEIENAAIALKGSAPGIVKEVDTHENAGVANGSVAIGDTVDYTLTVDIPSYPADATVTRFVIGDTLSSGLTLDTGSLKIYIGDQNTELPAQYYSLDTDTANSFAYTMTDHYKEITAAYATANKIYVTYSATVNANAFVQGLDNTAFVGYTNDPYIDSNSRTEDKEIVYTYGVEVTKYIKGQATTLDGATFQLSDGTGAMEFVSLGNGTYRLPVAGDGATTTDLTVHSNGKLVIQGLDLGTYTLTETAAPEGYVLPTEGITITLADDNANGAPDGVLDDDTQVSGTIVRENSVLVSGKTVSLGVDNTNYEDDDFNLPATGGMGTMIFTVAGILLMGGAVILVAAAMKKKKSN